MTAAAVLYVGDLDRMRGFYQRCFGLTVADAAEDHCGLSSDAWRLTLVRSPDAVPASSPAERRAGTPVKLAFGVPGIAALRPVITGLGGRVDPVESEWEFRAATHCDCVDPEGNVVQLIEAHAR